MPRKTQQVAATIGRLAAASMRPRPDAAENLRMEREREQASRASMRPRPDAAENRAREL